MLALRYILNGIDIETINIQEIDFNVYQDLYEQSRKLIFEKTHTIESNKKISKTLLGRVSPFKNHIKAIHKHDLSRVNPNAKNKKLSKLACARKGVKNSFYGKHHSQETIDILRQKNSKPVGMYDLTTGNLLKEFSSIKEAEIYLIDNNITTSSAVSCRISKVCRLNTTYNRAYGYNWRFINKA